MEPQNTQNTQMDNAADRANLLFKRIIGCAPSGAFDDFEQKPVDMRKRGRELFAAIAAISEDFGQRRDVFLDERDKGLGAVQILNVRPCA